MKLFCLRSNVQIILLSILGVYTLDIITQKGSQKGAYEGILAISNSANAPAPAQIQNQIKRGWRVKFEQVLLNQNRSTCRYQHPE